MGTGIASSTNGESWSRVYNSVFVTNDSVNAIAYGGGTFVVGGSNGKMACSADGQTWKAVANSTFESTAIQDIAYGNGRFVAIGDNGKIAYSVDGETWTAVTDSPTGGYKNRIAFGGGRFVTSLGYSSDGVTWTAQRGMIGGTERMYDIMYGGGRFVAVGIIGGDVGRIAYSNMQE